MWKKVRCSCRIIVLALLLCIAGSLHSRESAEGLEKRFDKKHKACITCHRIAEPLISGTSPFPEEFDPSSVCLDCHHYEQNHHPVNFIPGRAEATFMSLNSFPLFDGEIRCLTCHEAHGNGSLAPKPRLLRGGPYTHRTEICFRCHDKDLNTKVNPHVMLDERSRIREINGRPICLFCHTAVPDQTHAGEIRFSADVAFLCWRCHPPMEGEFFKNHFLVKPRKRTLAYMKAKEDENGVVFPLLNRDRITCSTCHNPHEDGVIRFSPAGAGADRHDRLRMAKERICSGCHLY